MVINDGTVLSVRELWSLLDRTRFAISRLRELELARFGLTIEQSSILYILTNREGPVTAKDLENITMRQHHSISSLIKGMTRMRLVDKVKGANEKRFKIIITQDGQNLYPKVPIASLKETLSSLAEPDRQRFTACLIRLLAKARDLLGIPDTGSLKIIDDGHTVNADLHIHEIWSLLDRTQFAISRLRELELSRLGLTVEQASILNIITHSGGSTTSKELEDVTMRRQHSISSLMSGMVNLGLVGKVKDFNERRFKIVITPKGITLFKGMTMVSLDKIFSVLPGNERQQLEAYLEILLQRSRYLLGIPYQPPFLQYLENDN